ncbi:MAG TPA: polymer-forming cytoskeletal protein [Acidobacteriaceae bacterium]|nr:polymer-forming cytoskeletal protein [Acidobacteriaceae bacterium]
MPPAEATAASIGKSVLIYGEVKGSEDLLVDGTIEGTITLNDSRLTIGPNAHIQANISARDVIILGNVTGNILASGRVELRAGSHIKGDIRASRLSIEENAIFSGKVELTVSERAANQTTSTATASASAPSGALFNATN